MSDLMLKCTKIDFG